MAKNYNGKDVYVQIKKQSALSTWNVHAKQSPKFLINRMPPFFNGFFGVNNFRITIFMNPGS